MNKKQLMKTVLINGKKCKENLSKQFLRNTASWLLAIIALISLGITYNNVELVNRPFVGIEGVYWKNRESTDWFISGFKLKNYGNKPALDYSVRNFKAIILSFKKDLLEKKVKNENQQMSEEYFTEYLLDLKNKICRETIYLLANYFCKHPDATKAEVNAFLESLKKKLSKNSILKFNGELLFAIVEVNNDMFNYFSKNSQIIYPDQDNLREELTMQIGRGGIAGVKTKDNFIITYWAIKYKGFTNKFLPPLVSKIYSTYSIGYNLQSSYNEVQEFRSWTNIE